MISSMRGGGSEQQTLLLLRNLDRAQFEPHLFLLEKQGHLLDSVPDDVSIHHYQPEVKRQLYFPGRILRNQVRQVRRLLISESIDVIYDRTYPMTLIGSAAADPIGLPRVSTIVSPPDRALRLVEKRFVAIKRRRLATAYGRSYQVIAVSEQAADAASDYYRLPRNKLMTIRNPVDIERLQQSASATRTTGDRHGIVVVGRMTSEKGHQDLLQALRILQTNQPQLLQQHPVSLIGDGPLRKSLEQLVMEFSLQSVVHFEGHSSEPAPAIAGAELLVLPSRFEGLPNVVLEAMALRTPVVATLSGGTEELDPDPRQPTLFSASPGQPESLTEAISKAFQSSAERKRRVENADRLLQRNHDLRSAVQQISECLLSATGQTR